MKWRAFGVATAMAGLALCLTGCVARGPMDYSDGPAGNDTPVEDRQYLDDYYAAVVPAILEYLHMTNEALGTDWKRSGSEDMFRVSECGYDDEREQYHMYSGSLIGNSAPLEEIVAAGDEMFLALGFTRSLSQEKEGVFHVDWTDWRNGGYISMTLSAESVRFLSVSECRYAYNADAIEYMVTILPMPPEESPSPSPTASRSARLVFRREAAASARPRRP